MNWSRSQTGSRRIAIKKCSKCSTEKLAIITNYIKNFTHGKKSKPSYVKQSILKRCYHTKQLSNGKLWKCGYNEFIHRNDVGGVLQ